MNLSASLPLADAPAARSKEALLAARKRFLMPCYYSFYRDPLWLARANGEFVWDEKGKRYADFFSGVGVVNCGHGRAEIAERVAAAIGGMDHATTIYLTEPMIGLAERLAALAPGPLSRVFFCSSGSEANDGAAVLATLATGRNSFIAFDRGLHGRTLLTMNLTGLPMWRTELSLGDRVLHLPTPDCSRCPYMKSPESCGLYCAAAAKEAVRAAGPENFAAMIAEPVLGNGGIVVPPPGYFAELSLFLRSCGILWIDDEMQTGFGRTGRWFGIEHHWIEPDILSVAKALGNGVPVGAFLATERVAAAYTKPGASTFGGNGASMAAAHAVLDIMEREDLPARAARLGVALREGLLELKAEFSRISDVRGLGLMLGAEVSFPGGEPDPAGADELLEGMKERGFLLGKTGPNRNVLAFMPPLVVEAALIGEMISAFGECLRAQGSRP